MRTLLSKGANWFGFCYVEFFCNMPLLVQLFLWFFVLPELLPRAAGTRPFYLKETRTTGRVQPSAARCLQGEPTSIPSTTCSSAPFIPRPTSPLRSRPRSTALQRWRHFERPSADAVQCTADGSKDIGDLFLGDDQGWRAATGTSVGARSFDTTFIIRSSFERPSGDLYGQVPGAGVRLSARPLAAVVSWPSCIVGAPLTNSVCTPTVSSRGRT